MSFQVQVMLKGTTTLYVDTRRYAEATPKIGDEIQCFLDGRHIRAKVTEVDPGLHDFLGEFVDTVTADEIGPA